MTRPRTDLPPAIVIGGGANALSVARSLTAAGVRVYALNYASEYVRWSRFCTWLPVPQISADGRQPTGARPTANGPPSSCPGEHGESAPAAWTRYLLGSESDPLRGAVLLACSDVGIQILARHRDELLRKFLLDISDPRAQLCMLDKLCTYRQAVEAGVPTPRFWEIDSRERVLELQHELVYPVLVKPLLSHVYQHRFGRKFGLAHSFDELLRAYEPALEAGIGVMLVESIPGPDDRLCSYYTYLDEEGRALFSYTKRVIRRYPLMMGPACYHVTDRVPGVEEHALRLFRHVGLRGLANVEFKHDERDGRLKLIECNARFTAANALVAASGYDLARFVYNRIIGRPQAPLGEFRVGTRLWYPLEDFYSFLQLRKQGELTTLQWLASLAHPKMLPHFALNDPVPTLVREFGRLRDAVTRRLGLHPPFSRGFSP